MENSDQFRGGSRAPGGKVKEFFSWLRGLWSPKYIPQRLPYGDRGRKIADQNSDLETHSNEQ